MDKNLVQGNRLPLNILIVEGSSQSYAYSSIMFHQFVRAYFENRLSEFMEKVLEERRRFLSTKDR